MTLTHENFKYVKREFMEKWSHQCYSSRHPRCKGTRGLDHKNKCECPCHNKQQNSTSNEQKERKN